MKSSPLSPVLPFDDSPEEWRPVAGYENTYEVSNLGRVRRNRTCKGFPAGRIKSQQIAPHGYPCVHLFRGYTRTRFAVHRLVAKAFLGPIDAGLEVNHRDGNKQNNRLENLELVTRRENCRHAVRIGLMTTGERRPRSKLTAEKVRAIRAAYTQGGRAAGGKGQEALAKEHGVCRETIRDIVKGRAWTHLLDGPARRTG